MIEAETAERTSVVDGLMLEVCPSVISGLLCASRKGPSAGPEAEVEAFVVPMSVPLPSEEADIMLVTLVPAWLSDPLQSLGAVSSSESRSITSLEVMAGCRTREADLQ